MRILVVEMHDKADGDQIFVEMVDERASAGRTVERPALAVHDQSAMVLIWSNLPQLLDPDAVFLRIDAVAKVEALHQLLRK